MKVLVTGATGFIGSHVVESLTHKDVEIIATSRDKNKATSFGWYDKARYIPYDMNTPAGDIFDELGRPDLLIHLAWEGLPNYQASFHREKNYPMHCSFLKNMVGSGLKKLVVIGTCLEYGMKTGCLSEEMESDPVVAYAKAKDDLRKYIEGLRDKGHFDFKWVRLFYIFGSGQHETSLLPQLQKAIDRGDLSFNMSQGEQLRDYLPVEQVAEKIVRISLQDKIRGVINCCSGRPTSVKDFVENYLRTVNKKIDLNWGYYPYLDYEPKAFWGDTRRLKEALNMSSRIYYTKPSITEREVRYATDAAANGWGEKCYDYIYQFEEIFRKHLGVKYAIATSSCTGALHMGLAAIGIRPGDEIILADINWIASAAPITYLGARPVFVDVLPDTWCLDPAKVEAAIGPCTKAILAVHVYGNLCDMDALYAIGNAHGIPVIEDAAEALGSIYHGQRAGSMGLFGTFSFHGTKTITTGEGGMFVTNDDVIYEKVFALSNHGRARGQTKQFWPDMAGFKYKMSDIQAAIGCAQMERVDELIAGKRRIFAYYAEHLQGLALKMNPEPAGTVNGYWMPSIVVNEGVFFDREALLRAFKEDHIDGRVFFWPLSMLPMFEKKPENVVSYGLYGRAINLPSYHDLTATEMDRVIGQVRAKVKRIEG